MNSTSRRFVLKVSAATFLPAAILLVGCNSKPNTQLSIPSLNMKKSPLSEEEFELLEDVDARKKAVGDGPLTVTNRMIGGGDDIHRLDKTTLENIRFVDCLFIGHKMFDVDMKNINFERCAFTAVRWEGGRWFDSKFTECGFFERDVSILPGGGGGTTLLERCYFKGSDPDEPKYESDLRYYGKFGVGGTSRYVECEFQQFKLFVDLYMELENCKCDRFSLSHSFQTGALGVTMQGCAVKGEIAMPNRIIQDLTLRNSTFERVYAGSFKGNKVVLDKVRGCFEFVSCTLDSMSATDCTFIASERPSSTDEVIGLGVGWSEMKSLTLERCKFEGAFSKILAAGAEPDRDKDGKEVPYIDPKTKKVVNPYTEIDSITLRNTPLVNGYFIYSHIKQLSIEDATFADTKLPQSKIGKLVLKNVKLSGKLDFTNTQVKEVVAENVTKDKLTIVRDKATELELSASMAGQPSDGLRRWFG